MYSKGSLTSQTPMHLLVITDYLLSKNDLRSRKIKPRLTKLQIKIMFVFFKPLACGQKFIQEKDPCI